MDIEKQPVTLVPEESVYVFSCPHCLGTVVVHVNEVNCQIFRHAVMKATGEQVNPHAPKAFLDQLVAQDLIHGCGMPFRIIDNNTHVVACEYI